jgi:hypothetical protein
MFRTLIVLVALALSGCASYGPSYRSEREPVYRDGSYYSPSASGYGDYYYAPEYRYDSYYDDFGYDFGYPYGNGFGGHRFCSFRYRPCSYGSYWGSGFGMSLFFGRGWNSWDPWYPWPYYGGGWHDRDRDRDRDWNRDHGNVRPRQPTAPYPGDRNQANPPGAGTGWPSPRNTRPPRTDTPIPIREPYPVRDRNRPPGYGDERSVRPAPMPMPRDRNVVVMPRDPNVAPMPVVVAPRDRNGGGWQQVEAPAPRAPTPMPRDRNDRDDDSDRPSPPPVRERSGERRDNVRRDGSGRPALQ